MSDRFTKIFDLPSNLYCESAPVIIRAGALHIDNLSGKVAAQLKMQSISPKAIKTVTVSIFPIDGSGNKIDPPTVFQYLDLRVDRDQEFGQKKIIYLPNKNTRSFGVRVIEVIFSDNSIWSSADGEWAPIQTQEKIFGAFSDFELTKQFQNRYGSSAEFFPSQQIDLVLCTCGAVSRNGESLCHKCGNNLEYILSYDRESLERDKEARLAEEKAKAEAEEAARLAEAEKKALEKQEKLKKVKAVLKKVTLAVVCAAVLALAVYGIGWHAIPAIRYNSADKALSEKDFDKAYNTFAALGDYKDSSTRATETLYGKGLFLKENEAFSDAAIEFEKIPDYLDSAEQAVFCKNKANYLDAKSLLETKEYEKAAAAFADLENFEDSAELAVEANYLFAKELFAEGNYSKALELLKGLAKENYKDSADLLQEVTYQYAIVSFEKNNFEDAYNSFISIPEYKDVPDRITESTYQYALLLEDSEQWEKAKKLFNSLDDYNDSAAKWKFCNYQYALQMMHEKQYQKAVVAFQELEKYEDSETLLLEARYNYVLANKNIYSYTTYQYLTDLKAKRYKDTEDIYKELYSWKVTIIAINTSENSTANMSSISRYNELFVHFIVSGGAPGDSFNLKARGKFPNGSTTSSTSEYKWYNGDSGYWSFYYTEPAYGSPGTFTVEFYDSSGNVIGTGSVRIT